MKRDNDNVIYLVHYRKPSAVTTIPAAVKKPPRVPEHLWELLDRNLSVAARKGNLK